MFSEISTLSEGEGREPYCNHDLEETLLLAAGPRRNPCQKIPSRFAFGIKQNL
jgi:hypothetical protein